MMARPIGLSIVSNLRSASLASRRELARVVVRDFRSRGTSSAGIFGILNIAKTRRIDPVFFRHRLCHSSLSLARASPSRGTECHENIHSRCIIYRGISSRCFHRWREICARFKADASASRTSGDRNARSSADAGRDEGIVRGAR